MLSNNNNHKNNDPLFDKSSIMGLTGMVIFFILFSVLKACLCEGSAAQRLERHVIERRKELIRNSLVVKKIISQQGRDTPKKCRNSESLSLSDDHQTKVAEHSISSQEERQIKHSIADETMIKKECNCENAKDPPRSRDTVNTSTDVKDPTTSTNSTTTNKAATASSTNTNTNTIQEVDQSPECQICLEYFQVGDRICWSRNLNCIHVFHYNCLESWLLKHEKCPLCRATYLFSNQRRRTNKKMKPPILSNTDCSLRGDKYENDDEDDDDEPNLAAASTILQSPHRFVIRSETAIIPTPNHEMIEEPPPQLADNKGDCEHEPSRKNVIGFDESEVRIQCSEFMDNDSEYILETLGV